MSIAKRRVVLTKLLDLDRDSITFNDQSQSLVQAGTVFQTQLAWAADVPTGTVLLGQSAQVTSNSLDNRSFVSNHGKDHAQYDANDGGQIHINDQIMSTIAGDLVTTTASTGTSINYAGQSQLIADGKLDAAATGQTGEYHLEDRSRYRIQDTESIQSLWANDAWTETGHNFTVDHEGHDTWIYNQTVNLPINSDPIITNNPDGSTSSQIIRLGQDQSTVTSAGGYDYHLIQSGSPSDFVFSLNHTSQSQSGKHDTGTWRAADGTSGATYDNLGSETKGSRANLSGRVQNGSVYYDGIDVYQTRNTSTNNTGSGFALGSTTNSHTVGSTQTTESRGGNSGSWYGSKLESGNSTTNYTTVSGTMGQPFSGMTQTGFNITTLYGTAAQTGITGMYGSYGQTGTGGSYNTLQTGGTGTPSGPVLLPSVNGIPNCSDSSKNIGRRPEPNTIYNAYILSAYRNKEYMKSYFGDNDLIKINLQRSLGRIYYAKITGQLENKDTTPKELDELDKSLRLGIAGLAIYGGGSNLSGPQALQASAVLIGQTLPAHLAEKGVEFGVEGLTQNALGKFAGALFNASKGIYRLVGGKLHKIIRKGGVEVAETISDNELNKVQKYAKEFAEKLNLRSIGAKTWQEYESGIRSLYGEASFKSREFTTFVNGKIVNGVADNVVTIGGRNIAVEAKFVKDGWAKSLRNPASTIGNRPFAVAEKAMMVEQARKYSAAFDEVIYHSNCPELIAYYTKIFQDAGITNIRFILTP